MRRVRNKWTIGLGMVLLGMLVGCGETGSAMEAPKETEATIVVEDIVELPPVITEAPTPEETPTPTPEPPYEPVTIGFAGDIHFSTALYNTYKETEDIASVLQGGMLDLFQNVNIMIANHEFCATSSTAIDTNQIYNIKAPQEREFLWGLMGVDAVSLANNHMLDFGKVSVFDTIEILDKEGILHCGAGENLEAALKPIIWEQNGKKIALLAASRVVCSYSWHPGKESAGVMTTYESTDYFQTMQDEITRLKTQEGCDFVMVYVHFGTENTTELNASQKKISYAYIDAGADLIMGSHAHTLQGIEIHDGVPIYYNLGNFLFGAKNDNTMFVEIDIQEDNTCTTRIYPATTNGHEVTLAADEKKEKIIEYVEKISVNVQIDSDGNVTLSE